MTNPKLFPRAGGKMLAITASDLKGIVDARIVDDGANVDVVRAATDLERLIACNTEGWATPITILRFDPKFAARRWPALPAGTVLIVAEAVEVAG